MTISLPARTLMLADFAGDWRFVGSWTNADGAEAARVAGLARFVDGEGGLVLTETGEMRMSGSTPMHAERRSIWRDAAGQIEVLFGDGRPFHSFDPAMAWAEARHDCTPDIYHVVYDFSRFPDLALDLARFRAAQGLRDDHHLRPGSGDACLGGCGSAETPGERRRQEKPMTPQMTDRVLAEALAPAGGAMLWARRVALVGAGVVALAIAAKLKVTLPGTPVPMNMRHVRGAVDRRGVRRASGAGNLAGLHGAGRRRA